MPTTNVRDEVLLSRYANGERQFSDYGRGPAWGNGAEDLSGANLSGAIFSGADLSKTQFSGATLDFVNFTDASLRSAELTDANLVSADLTGADIRHASLRKARLRSADLKGANLSGADLTGANLRSADLTHANLTGANLIGANLRSANLTQANLRDANLTGANLSGANLTGANLDGASAVRGVKFGGTTLCDVDLTPFCRNRGRHFSSSSVDFRSIIRSVNAPRLKDFLRATGMPDVFVEYMIDCARSLDSMMAFSLLQSTFISYGGPDEEFAQKLNGALESYGVTTFFFKDDAPPGEKLHRIMRKGVNEHDRVILVCSEASLQRPGLMNELEETLARESRDGGRAYLIPIRLDDYVINGWNPTDPDMARAVRDRVIADFRRHHEPAQFEVEVARVIAALKTAGPTSNV